MGEGIFDRLKRLMAERAEAKKNEEQQGKPSKKGRWVYLLRALPKAEARLKGDKVFAVSDRLYIQDEKGQLWRARKFEDGKVGRSLPRAKRKARQWKRLGYTI